MPATTAVTSLVREVAVAFRYVAPDAVRRVHAGALGAVGGRRPNDLRRHDPVFHNLLVVIHVVDEEVERGHDDDRVHVRDQDLFLGTGQGPAGELVASREPAGPGQHLPECRPTEGVAGSLVAQHVVPAPVALAALVEW